MPTYFEGPEKKVELVTTLELRELGDDFWRGVVAASGAQVLSILRSSHCDAYLLSESSLFVFDRYITMITCGQTRLVDAIELLVERLGRENIALLMYERKNEHFPERQPTSFYEDAQRLNALIGGEALRFGDAAGHHVLLFHSRAPYAVHADDTTLEILMHGIPHEIAERFVDCGTVKSVASDIGLSKLMPSFSVDEHAFEPAGYSMNGLDGENYYTVHVTPERIGSYVSFETNLDFRANFSALVGGVVEIFHPRSFDVMAFVPKGDELTLSLPGIRMRDRVRTTVHGYDIAYWQGYRPVGTPRAPFTLPL
ncbi:MAG: adenosylmethionine decarboxylase [Myxococcota bacterium]